MKNKKETKKRREFFKKDSLEKYPSGVMPSGESINTYWNSVDDHVVNSMYIKLQNCGAY